MYQITNNWFVQQLMHKLISLKGGASVGYVPSFPSCPLSFASLLDCVQQELMIAASKLLVAVIKD